MAFRKGGAGKRRDANEAPIVQALRAVGCTVYQVGGRGLPDLLVRVPGPTKRLVGLEVKTASGTRTAAQVGPDWEIVRSVDEALAAVWR